MSISGLVFARPAHALQEAAADSLANLSDVINVNKLASGSAEHRISFTLPTNSDPIRRIDYIQIYFEHFSDLTPPIYIFGEYAGDPFYSVDGKYVRITGIRVQPGAYISIEGITTTNPTDEKDFQVMVMVTDGDDFTVLKNVGTTIATVNRGSVTITASIEAALANLRISGYTSPYSFIIFSEHSSVLGTDVSNQTGAFIKYFSGMEPTTHQITFYAVDQYNFNTTPQPLYLYTPAYQETTISNQILSPTISLNTDSILPGDPLVASGSALPNGAITLFTDAPLRSYVTTANAEGLWSYTIADTDDYIWGDYRAYALVQSAGGFQSLFSPSLFFTVTTGDVTGSACGDITSGDLNCDGQINLADFSILMYYWGTTNSAADINLDNIVNLTDFSIMMYWWGT